jgi:hypothetical protein
MAREVISGVGSMARRTDMNISEKTTQPMRYMAGGQYGEGQELLATQGAAPMQGAPETQVGKIQATPRPTRQLPPPPTEPIVPLTSPTLRPTEAPENGLPFGPGLGVQAVTQSMPRTKPSDLLFDIMQTTGDGEAQALYEELKYLGL